MRAPRVAFFLLSLLVLYTISAPVVENNGLAGFLDAPLDFAKSLLPGGRHDDAQVQARDLVSQEEEIGLDIEKRGRARGGRTRKKRPARKRPQRKKKPVTKKPKKPANRKPPTKKPKKDTCKTPKGTKDKNGKLIVRAGEPAGQSCPPKQKVKKTANYRVLEKAAKKAGKPKLIEGHAYLLRFKSEPGLVNHQHLIMGVVKKRTHNPADGALDFEATSLELIKPLRVPTNWKAKAKQECLKVHGAKCKHRGIERHYECKAALKKWPKGEFHFKGNANPEFAVPSKFVQTGKTILEKDTTYDIVYNNCGTFARKLENVAELKKGQNPLVDIELEDLENLTLEDAE